MKINKSSVEIFRRDSRNNLGRFFFLNNFRNLIKIVSESLLERPRNFNCDSELTQDYFRGFSRISSEVTSRILPGVSSKTLVSSGIPSVNPNRIPSKISRVPSEISLGISSEIPLEASFQILPNKMFFLQGF